MTEREIHRADCEECGWRVAARTAGSARAAMIDHRGYCLPLSVRVACADAARSPSQPMRLSQYDPDVWE